MSIWLSGSRTSHQPFSVIFFISKPLHSSSSLSLSCPKSKCGFNEVLMLFFFFKCFSAGLDNWHSLSSFCLFSAWNIKEPWSSFLSFPRGPVWSHSFSSFPLSPPVSPTSLLSLQLPACPDRILLRPFRIFRGRWLD